MPTTSSTLATHAPHDCYGVHPEVLLRTHRSWDGTPYQGYPDGRIELTLSPETLGRVHFDMRPDATGLSITLSAERPETLYGVGIASNYQGQGLKLA